MKYEKLGNIIVDIDLKNKTSDLNRVLGVNIYKNFMPSVANLTNVDLSKYRIVSKNQFAVNIMHVDRDERLPIALYKEDIPTLVSPAYKVFGIKTDVDVLPEYLMINFLRPEFDRLAWYLCDSSVRGGLEWYRFKEIEIPILPIEEQKKYVSIYNALLKNQSCYENSLEDLQLICDSYIENLIKTEPKKKLGDYIEAVDNRNTNLQNNNLLGISVNKVFIPTKSKKEDLNLSNYKIVNKREFSFVTVTSRNGEKLSIALLDEKPGLVSATYNVFKVKDIEELLPEFLLLWFSRPEFDRYARYHSWGSARETFNWEDMCDVMLPIPDIEKQKAIVTIYHTLETRKKINEKLKESLQPLCPILMKGVRDSIQNN
ncbi:restriction endonuclease subunit S [Myroides odoratimimus]|uniref:restriction endonuclease subunit S n=1 Tax=Myroides odoratimimus TaxID=76832 RepID=UPI002DB726EF|nr:restriction endonuclease subunit S [Myroides odoratimimus]MEC4043365.1 restriction endonuclease subunit S [Myroides odoratimimus]MEC4151245.1 restriction endonuclease subunit S [Myroides odoratimimus]